MPLPSEPKMAMEQVASVIRPVSVTMLFVVYCVVALCNPYSLSQADCRATGGANALSMVMVYRESASDSSGARLGGSILNAAMIVLMFTVVTFFMYCLYKCLLHSTSVSPPRTPAAPPAAPLSLPLGLAVVLRVI
jgi:hypothetical protein